VERVDLLAAVEGERHFDLDLVELLLRPGHQRGERRARIGRRLGRDVHAKCLARLPDTLLQS
jgi:hypothetical protein